MPLHFPPPLPPPLYPLIPFFFLLIFFTALSPVSLIHTSPRDLFTSSFPYYFQFSSSISQSPVRSLLSSIYHFSSFPLSFSLILSFPLSPLQFLPFSLSLSIPFPFPCPCSFSSSFLSGFFLSLFLFRFPLSCLVSRLLFLAISSLFDPL
jgi:hypothetical protein